MTTILWLIDAYIGPTKLDLQTWDYLVALGRPIRIVATKIDKVSSSKRPRRKSDFI